MDSLQRGLVPLVLLLLACVLQVTSAQPAQAAEAVGWVQEVSGSASILSDGKNTPATVGLGVAPKDTVSTAKASRVQIMFKDKTTLALAEMSECVIGDVYLEASDKKKARFNLNIVKGFFGFLAGAIAKENPQGFKVESPLVAMGIRGTEFASSVGQQIETHGLYEGGPVVVTATKFKKASAALPADKKEEICDRIKDTIEDMERAYRSKRGAGEHSDAKKYDAKAEEYEKLFATYQCE